MSDLSEIMMRVLDSCELKLDNQVISKELLMKTYAEFLSQTINKRGHNVGIVLHTGSICFDVLAVTYSAIVNLITNQSDVSDVLESLSVGDTVLYGGKKKERYIFKGYKEGIDFGVEYKDKKFIVLEQEKGKCTYASEKLWRLIEPYNGVSKRLDGRGIRKKNTVRDNFYTEILGYNEADIPSVIDTSSVIVSSRDIADRLVKGISIGFNGKEISFSDLVTASYFTDEDEYRYGGNTGKNEPIIKFTSKLSVARSLLLSKKGNKHLGIMVLGNDTIQKAESEIPELINRKSLQYVYICAPLDSISGSGFIDDYEEFEVFACTKDFLLEHTVPEASEENSLTRELIRQANTVIDKKCEMILLKNHPISKEEYRNFKQNIVSIKRMEFESSEKDNFIVHAHSLMNLFITAPFPMVKMDMAKERGLVEVDNPELKIENLGRWAETFLGGAYATAENVIDCLKNVYERVKNDTPKYTWLREFLNSHQDSKIAVVVPKAYYITILKDLNLFSFYAIQKVKFFTANRFDNAGNYDYILALGDYDGKNFNSFRCNAALNIVSVLYESEIRGYQFKKKAVHNDMKKYQKKSTIIIKHNNEVDDVILEDEEDTVELEKEIEEFIANAALYSTASYAGYRNSGSGAANIPAEIIAIASFGDETKAYFSRHYKGYVLDESSGIVKEVGASDFCEGDSIVFTQNNEETRDIVRVILNQLVDDGKLDARSQEQYRLANLWKNALIDFMYVNGYSARQVAQLMIEDGATVQEPTILRWLDEDAHTVGPRNLESIQHIGNITGIEMLINSPETIFEACKEVRSIRRKILEQIGNAIIDKLSGKSPKPETEFIYERVDKLATIMQIESIVFTETTVPMSVANRPITIQ